MVHLDPGPNPSHELERADCSLQLGRDADSLEPRLMGHGGVGRKGEGEHPREPGPVLYSDTAVDRGRVRVWVRVRVRGLWGQG